MSQQQDLSRSARTQLHIDINFNSFLDHEYIKADLAIALERMKAEGQILQYSLRRDETRDTAPGEWMGFITDIPSFYELGRDAVQVTTVIAKDISENKDTLQILTNLVTILSVTINLVHDILRCHPESCVKER